MSSERGAEPEPDLRWYINPAVDREGGYPRRFQEILSLARHQTVHEEIGSWPGYRPTHLFRLNGRAERLEIAELWYKDEADRFGLGSFKALGGPYGVFQVLRRELASARAEQSQPLRGRDFFDGPYREAAATITVTCATDGNHGRAVAWGAQLFGCRSVVYLPAAASPGREAAIASCGAETVRVEGTYDDAVRRADQDAQRNGWKVVSDQSYPGYEVIPRDVMQGYTTLFAEAIGQMGATEPTHVVVQGGVGGLAAAACSYLWELRGANRPVIIVIEPHAADALYRSARAGEPAVVPGDPHSIMACLSCGEVSVIAWPILAAGVDSFATIPDRAAEEAMRSLASGVGGDRAVVGGESGVAGLAGLSALARDPRARREVGLDRGARVLVIGTEGATDLEIYERIVGRSVDQVRGGES